MFGSPIELIIPAGVSQRRGGGLPARGSGVIVFETKAEKGNCRSSASPKARRAAIASKVPEPLITGCSSSMPQKLGGESAHRCPDPATSAVSICSPPTTGPSTQRRM